MQDRAVLYRIVFVVLMSGSGGSVKVGVARSAAMYVVKDNHIAFFLPFPFLSFAFFLLSISSFLSFSFDGGVYVYT